jgi:hypothetical protein
MAEEEWAANGKGNNWSTYNYNNAGFNDQNPTISYNTPATYVTTTSRAQPPQAPQHQRPSPKKDGFSSLFIAETSFPSWED